MAMKVSIDGKATATDGKATAPGQAGAGNGAAVRVTARVAAAFRILGTSLLQAFERIASAHASAGRRKQMKLVESLALGNRRQLLLIDCGNQRYLVGAGADSVGSILAMDQGSASGDLKAKGPELVRRNGQAAAEHRRAGAAAEAGPALWR